MAFDLKTILFAAGYFVTCLSFVFAFFYKLKNMEKENRIVKKIIFMEQGGLNVVTANACKDFQSGMDQRINLGSAITKEALDHIKYLNDNVLIIMTKMDLEPRAVGAKRQKGFKHRADGG